MTDTNRIVTLGVVAVLGFAVGYTAEKDTAKELKSLSDQLSAIEARVDEAATDASRAASRAGAAEGAVSDLAATVAGLEGVADQVAALDERAAGLEAGQDAIREAASGADDAAAERMESGLAALTERIEGLASAGEARSATLEERLSTLSRDVTAAAAAAAASASAAADSVAEAGAGSDAAPASTAAAAEPPTETAPESDFVLGFGQSADIGGLLVFASRMDGEDAILRVPGLGSVSVGPNSGSAALGNGCSVDLVAIEGRQLYLDSECSGEAVAAAPMEVAAGDMGEPFTLSPGETAGLGDSRVFLSRVAGEKVHLRVAGAGDLVLGPGSAVGRVSADCAIALAGIDGRNASFRSNCATEGAAGDAGGSADASSGSNASGAGDLVASAGPDEVVIRIGETQSVGEASVFFSRRDGDDVVLFVKGEGPVTVGPGAGNASIGGCSVSLVGIDGGQAVLKPDC
ncbi:MAG: hypothetical protein AAF371_03570 [Pseudomonadota bacterium]